MAEFECALIALKDIRISPKLTPDSLSVTSASGRHCEVEKGILGLQADFNRQYIDHIRLWRSEAGLWLIDGYPIYRAHLRRFGHAPEQHVPCVVLQFENEAEAMEHTQRVRRLLTVDSNLGSQRHFRLMLSIKMFILANPRIDLTDIERIFGVSERSGSERQKIQRYFRLATSKSLLARLLGVPLAHIDDATVLPNLDKASLDIGTCINQLLPVLGHDPEALERFDAEYERYLDRVRARPSLESDLSLPIHRKSTYDKREVRALAEDCATGVSTVVPQEERIRPWSINQDDRGNVCLPPYRFSLSTRDRENIRCVVEAVYLSSLLSKAGEAYLQGLAIPYHGGSVKSAHASDPIGLEVQAGAIDTIGPYFSFIRRHRLLRYCNPERFLRSIRLKPTHFGFIDAKPMSVSSYLAALTAFQDWTDSASPLSMNTTNRATSVHPIDNPLVDINLPSIHHTDEKSSLATSWDLYQEVKTFLIVKAAATHRRPVEFRTFFLEVFSHVLAKMENKAKSEQAEALSIRRALSVASEKEREHLVDLIARSSERQEG